VELIAVIVLVVVGAFGTILMKIGAAQLVLDRGLQPLLLSAATNLPLIAGIGIQFVPLAGWTILLKTMPLTKLQPMIALTYVVTPVLPYLLLGEPMTALGIGGILLIGLGVILVAGS